MPMAGELVELGGIEPPTSCVPRRRSPQLSYSPEVLSNTYPKRLLPLWLVTPCASDDQGSAHIR